MSTFAQRLKHLREAAGFSQPELARRAGMNRFGVAKLEQGVREPGWATVQALAKALGVTVLVFADDAPPPGQDGQTPEAPTDPSTTDTPPRPRGRTPRRKGKSPAAARARKK
jgi:transcriptional regulator with XRE-family HTH domain